MDARVLEQLQRISAAGIELLPAPQIGTHFVFTRDGCAVIVEKRGDGFGGIGSPGRIGERGFEVLVERNGRTVFAGRGAESAATEAEAAAARRLLKDLQSALL